MKLLILSMVSIVDIVKKELSKQVSDLTREFYEEIMPPVDVYEEEGYLTVKADIPGFKKEDINVRVVGQETLVISASREAKKQGVEYVIQRPRKVERQVKLPVKVAKDAEVIGRYEDGVLTLRIPVEGAVRVKIE